MISNLMLVPRSPSIVVPPLIERLFMLFLDGISMENECPLTVFAFTMSLDTDSWAALDIPPESPMLIFHTRAFGRTKWLKPSYYI